MSRLPVSPLLWTAAWAALVFTGLATRPLLPVDETRYLAVAWEMWAGGDFLVPHLNGEPYSHKPPLLFWLIHAGWLVLGVNEWWARLVAPLFGLGSLALTHLLARRLWPERPEVAEAAPIVLLGGVFWGAFTTLTFFDMLVCFFALAALLGIVDAARNGGWRGWLIAAIATGLGVLAKGPVILVYVLPAALTAPLWVGRTLPPSWAGWYARLAMALLLAAAVVLAWAVPAAISGGAAYAEAILWGQTAGRVSDSFAHERSWWFYPALFPALLFPWCLWPPLWRGLVRLGSLTGDPGNRFCLAWLALAGLVLTFVSGKQPHYLVPLLPAAALLIAAVTDAGPARRLDRWPLVFAFALPVLALALAIGVPPLPQSAGLPPLVRELAPLAALPAAIAAVLAVWLPRWRMVAVAAAGALLVAAGHLAIEPHLRRAFDLGPLAGHVAGLQREGFLVAHVHKYHGQYHFLGRLEKPLAITWQHEALRWARQHPDARMIVTHDQLPEDIEPEFSQRYRSRLLAVWDARTVIEHDIVKP